MNEPEFRRCPITGRTVIFAPQRAERPMTLRHSQPHHRGQSHQHDCPFCVGNEQETPPELFALRNETGWQLRVFPNKYPAVLGLHEVLIPCPEHRTTPSELSEPQFSQMLFAYAERIREFWRNPLIESVSIFKNVGAEAGASLAHLHSQLLALPFVPELLAAELRETASASTPHPNPPPQGGRGQNQETLTPSPLGGEGRGGGSALEITCQFCAMTKPNSRIVVESEHFIVACPFAPRFAYEMWALPKEHRSRYESITMNEATELGQLFKRVLAALDSVLDAPAYNWFLHTSPRTDHPHYHWHFEIVPRTTRVAGFEWGTGVFINSVFPERAAHELQLRLEKQLNRWR